MNIAPMQKPIHKVLAELMERHGISQAELSRGSGVGQPTISRILNPSGPKGIKSPSDKQVKPLADYFGISTDELRGHAPMTTNSYAETKESAENVTWLGRAENTMPLIGWVKAGEWCESPDEFAPGDAEEWLPRPKNAGPRSFALRVQNDSMTSPYPGQRSYPEGTVIYVDPDKPINNGSRVVARANGDYTFKVYVEDAGRKYLKPINPQYPTIDITDDVHICGVVIWSMMAE